MTDLSVVSAQEAYHATRPSQDALLDVLNDIWLNGAAVATNRYQDTKDKIDAIYNGKLISIHNRQDGVDINQVLSQGVYQYDDLLDPKKIKKGRDFFHKYDFHAYQTGPWIHLIKFDIIWFARQRSLEYLKETIVDWKKVKWTKVPNNIKKEWLCQITKYPDKRDGEPKVSLFMPPLPSTFGDDLRTCKFVDGQWKRWNWKTHDVE